MLIEELFDRGVMVMGPSRVDPTRQVGIFAPEVAVEASAARAAEIERFRWIVGEWRYENLVPQTRSSPAYTDIGTQRFAITEDGWVCMVSPDATQHRFLTFDPFSRQWIYVLTRGSFGMLRSKEGWAGDRIAFSGLMTMIGIECEWRMTWTKINAEEFRFVNEEKISDGSWAYIDEWHFRSISGATVA
ncbi:MAG TPA: hypothetical protein VMT15_12905 [Bryobacteraceae bacterium]|nr:hypothetical protein [Bryobacteraceae bacterium]